MEGRALWAHHPHCQTYRSYLREASRIHGKVPAAIRSESVIISTDLLQVLQPQKTDSSRYHSRSLTLRSSNLFRVIKPFALCFRHTSCFVEITELLPITTVFEVNRAGKHQNKDSRTSVSSHFFKDKLLWRTEEKFIRRKEEPWFFLLPREACLSLVCSWLRRNTYTSERVGGKC